MKKVLTILASVMLAVAASAQLRLPNLRIDPVPPKRDSGLCIVCSCKVEPGHVDECSSNYTFKNRLGGLVRVEASEPAACVQAVENNLEALSKHYGKRPEISLPTPDMATIADALSTPVAGDLPDSRLLDAAAPLDPSASLESRIRSAQARVTALSSDARFHLDVSAQTTAWKQASAAAQRLGNRLEGVDLMLSMGRPWPSLAGFAPKVWALVVCKRVQPGMVEQLSQRLANEDDDAWRFAFYGDWKLLLKPFGEKPQQAEDTKHQAFESIASPYFVEAADRVKVRSDKTLFTANDVGVFRRAIAQKATSVASYSSSRAAQTESRRSELLNSYAVEMAGIDDVRDAVKAQEDLAISLQVAVQSAASEEANALAEVQALTLAISGAVGTLAERAAERDRLLAERRSAASASAAKRADLATAKMALDSIVLECAGVPYQNCKDAAARLLYDRRLYEANVALAAARRLHLGAVEALADATSKLMAAESANQRLRASIGQQKQGMLVLLKKRDALAEELARATSRQKAKEDEINALRPALAELNMALDALQSVRP